MGIGGQLVTIVVDVANVMGSRPDGWWRDRAGAAARLHAQVVRLAAGNHVVLPGEPSDLVQPGFVLVLEGAARAAAGRLPPGEPGPGAGQGAGLGEVRVVQAPGSGDDTIVAVVRDLPGRRVVVTADRELRARCVAAGAAVAGPGWLLGLLGD